MGNSEFRIVAIMSFHLRIINLLIFFVEAVLCLVDAIRLFILRVIFFIFIKRKLGGLKQYRESTNKVSMKGYFQFIFDKIKLSIENFVEIYIQFNDIYIHWHNYMKTYELYYLIFDSTRQSRASSLNNNFLKLFNFQGRSIFH